MSSYPITIWAFDLGKASIGEAVRQTADNSFLHAESLLIPEHLARRGPASSAGTPANRYRALKTRQAHHARERWLEMVWTAVGLVPLRGRQVAKLGGKWQQVAEADPRLEREFASKGDNTCYTSCLLRIRLLLGDASLEEWQIYKALRAALQRRGYGRVPWAAKEAIKQGKTPQELEDEQDKRLLQADERYREAVSRWPEFKRMTGPEFHFPCYFDAWKMGLWDPAQPNKHSTRIDHLAHSTRNVRFDRADVRKEIIKLGDEAERILPSVRDAFAIWQHDGWNRTHPVTGAVLTYPVRARTFGEFLCDGPAGTPSETSFEAFRKERSGAGLRAGTFEEWMAALGQKTPKFDNRILNDCVLIPRFHVCKVDVRLDRTTGQPVPESLLATEVTFLLKLKNTLVADTEKGQRKLTPAEIGEIFAYAHRQLKAVKLVSHAGEFAKNWPILVANCFALTRTEWGRKTALARPDLKPLPGHEELKAPKANGRSAYSRVSLRILKELILSGDAPSAFHARLLLREEDLLRRLGSTPSNPLVLVDDSMAKDEGERRRENAENQRRGLLVSELRFLLQMRKDNATSDSWEDLFVPSQRLDVLVARHTDDGKLDSNAAIRELLGSVTDPIVRHRLGVFAERLKLLQFGSKESPRKNPGFGIPESIVLEFVREDFMGEQARHDYQKFINDREKERRVAREEASKLGLQSRSSGLRYELWKAQGGICLYSGQPLSETKLDEYEIDHIVPRALGGPDAAVNYVLTTHELNHTKEKGKMTPYALLHGKEGWDAYIERVNSRGRALRNKKVQLLTREDASAVVTRYTALAETAWVSKLAQTIVNLHFGWKGGCDTEGRKRVIVVSGGLTARVRRKYGLDRLLYSEITDREVLEKKLKNREDKRHHALDAMVLTFIPQWARAAHKEGFLRLPEGVNGDFFGPYLEQVMPRMLAYERAALADTSFGKRTDGAEGVIVQRVAVVDLGLQPSGAPGQTKFDLKYLRKQLQAVRDPVIKGRIQKFADTNPEADSWRRFCATLAQQRPDGRAGARIFKVWVNAATPTEFKDLSKDGNGAWRKAKDGHQGQIIFTDSTGELRVKPVYAHASIQQEMGRIREVGGMSHVHCFVRSDCLVRLEREIPAPDYKVVVRNELKQKRRVVALLPLSPGIYRLNTIITKSMDVELTSAASKRVVAPLRVLVASGFKPF